MRRRELMLLLGGAALAWPLAARAQQKAMPAIGYLAQPDMPTAGLAGFRQGLGETGYVEGQNLAIEYRLVEGGYDQLPVVIADLVGRKVDAIVALGTQAAVAAKSATSTIPIVFVMGGDPVGLGLVTSLSRPESNLTGISVFTVELMPKRLELLSELVPAAAVMALLVNPNNLKAAEHMLREVPEAARAKGLQLHILKATTPTEIVTAFDALVSLQAGALLVGADSFFNSRRDQLVALAARHAVPAMYNWRSFTASGGLISYGARNAGISRQVGAYVGRILKGEKPGDLPVQRPTEFELVINLKTAKALGLAVPQTLLARADEVIE
jgi:putative tryptophan/tyrosine transport system substrate-binding protein